MYIAMTLAKLLGEKDGVQKLTGIPVKALYKAGDTMEVANHLWLSAVKLKLEYVETVSTGNDAFDEGMTVGDLLRLPSDGVLVTESDSLLGTGSITRGKYTLTFAKSVKEALDICKKMDKKSVSKRRNTKSAKEKSEADCTDAADDRIVNRIPENFQDMPTNDEEDISVENSNPFEDLAFSMNPPDPENTDMTEEKQSETQQPKSEETVEAAENMALENLNRCDVKKFPEEIVSPEYGKFKEMLNSLGVAIANAPYILTAFQISDSTPAGFRKSLSYVYDGLEDDVNMIADALTEDLATLKQIADEIEPYEATLRD